MTDKPNEERAEALGEPIDAIRTQNIADLQLAEMKLKMAERLKAESESVAVDANQLKQAETVDPQPLNEGARLVAQVLADMTKERLNAIEARLDVLESHAHTHPHTTSWAPVPTHPKPVQLEDPTE
ncbi:MAG: hypothetical protein QM757_26565 [Paludibaculum sp.]